MSQNRDHNDKRFKLSRKKYILLLGVLIITIASISVYIELVVKPNSMNMNSKTHDPFAVYFHTNLNIVIDGNPVVIPSQIGINKSLWKDHSLDKYGVPGMPMDEKGEKNMPGMAPLYTNNDNGLITVGSIVERDYTLQDFLNIWGGIDLSDKKVNAMVNGEPVADYRNILLKDKEQIKLDIYSHQ